jgi:transposase-like protein
MSFKKEFLDELLKGKKTQDDLFGEKGLFKELQKALIQRILEAEMSHHLGYEKYEQSKSEGNYRNGSTPKKLLTDSGEVGVEIPRDRNGNF